MPWDGPIALAATAFSSYAWAHYFWGGATNSLGWAHCISSYCHRQLHLGPIISLQMRPITLNGPIAFAAAAADGIARAQLFFGRCFQYSRIGPLHLHLMLPMASH